MSDILRVKVTSDTDSWLSTVNTEGLGTTAQVVIRLNADAKARGVPVTYEAASEEDYQAYRAGIRNLALKKAGA